MNSFDFDSCPPKGIAPDFPVLCSDGRIMSGLQISDTLNQLPIAAVDYVFVSTEIRKKAEQWITDKRDEVLKMGPRHDRHRE